MTLARATLAVGVAALAADSFTHDTPVALLVTLAAVALALDAVDGWVARRTGTATALGARFDGEVDAFLILALSVYVAPAYGAWVLAIGAARYVFLAGEWLLPWMRAPLPPRRWRRLVAATQGVVLTVAAAGVLPRALTQALLVAALALLAASVGECTWWLWRRRHDVPERVAPAQAAAHGIAVALTVLALLLVWAALVAPNQPSRLTLGAFARLPLELLVVVAVGRPAARHPAPRAGRGRGSGAERARAREGPRHRASSRRSTGRSSPSTTRATLGIGIETLRDAIGSSSADLAVAVAVVLVVALLAVPVLALLRVTRVAAGHRGWALRAAAALGVVWVALRVVGAPVASSSAAALAVDEVQAVRTGLEDRAALARADRPRPLPRHARRPAADRPAGQGRPARVRRELREGRGPGLVLLAPRRRRARPGHRAAAGRRLLLAQRLPHLADLRRPQLAGALHPAVGGPGRRPAALRPARRERPPHPHPGVQARRLAGGRRHAGEPPGVAGGLDASTATTQIYDRRNLGYRGPDFGLPPMPDQYTLLALQRRELAKRHRPPLFAEVDLISSHAPWTRIPRLIPWDDVGDGSIFDRIPAEESTQAALFGDAERARAAYGHSIEYSLSTLFSFVQRYGDDDLVLVVLGDHQPATVVTGQGAEPRRADLGHRPRPEGDGPDRRMGLAGRHAAEPAGAGLADGRVPRPLPHRVRLVE